MMMMKGLERWFTCIVLPTWCVYLCCDGQLTFIARQFFLQLLDLQLFHLQLHLPRDQTIDASNQIKG